MDQPNPERVNKIVRTSLGLRDTLFDELDLLRNGESTPKRAAAVARVAAQIINSVKIEIEHQKHVSTLKIGADMAAPSAVLQLGGNGENAPKH